MTNNNILRASQQWLALAGSRTRPLSWPNWKLEMLVFQEEGEPERPEKDTGTENQQQTQPTDGTGLESNQWLTLMGGERSHHCATGPAWQK